MHPAPAPASRDAGAGFKTARRHLGRMIGKVDPESLAEHVFAGVGAADERVRQGPAYGEDAAAIEVGGETLVLSTDPVSLAAERVGTLGVHVACNDVAASGADPAWLTDVVFLHSPDALAGITAQIDRAAADLGVSVVGGHSEHAPDRERPLLAFTCLGLADPYVPTGGARPGDAVVLTKGAGIEGTAILASDFGAELDVPGGVVERAGEFYGDLSVVPEASILRGIATAMHDPTEGGLVDGFLELASAGGVALAVDPDAVPIRKETARLCGAAGVDPLRIFGSGALAATVPPGNADGAVEQLRAAGIEAAVVGTVEAADEPHLALGGEVIREPVRDDMYALWK